MGPGWLVLVCLVLGPATALDLHLDLTRAARQFGTGAGEGEGGVALGLVSALQKWANSLESQTSSLRSEMVGLKNSNVQVSPSILRQITHLYRYFSCQVTEELQQIKGQNINLKNEVTAAVERTQNVKALYQNVGDQLGQARRENSDLKAALGGQITVIKSQQERIEQNNQVDTATAMARMRLAPDTRLFSLIMLMCGPDTLVDKVYQASCNCVVGRRWTG